MMTPIWEEAVYRYAPIQILRALGKDNFDKLFLPVSILISLYFAEGHGPYLENVYIQGVLGLILSWICANKGYWYSVTFHSLYNLLTFEL